MPCMLRVCSARAFATELLFFLEKNAPVEHMQLSKPSAAKTFLQLQQVQEVLQQPDGTQEVANSSHATKK